MLFDENGKFCVHIYFPILIEGAGGIASGSFIFFLYHTHFYLLHDFMHRMVQHQHDKEIGNAMQDIVGNACHPPVERHDKTAFDTASHSADYDIGQGTICPKQKTVKPGQNGKHQHGVLFLKSSTSSASVGQIYKYIMTHTFTP